jgi:hypothetical protein
MNLPFKVISMAVQRVCATVLVLAASACQYDPFAHEFTHVKPEREALVGSYILEKGSAQAFRDTFHVPAPPARLRLNRDGSFEVVAIPTCWRQAAADCTSATENVRGTWKVSRSQEWWSVQFVCTNISGRESEYGVEGMIRRDEPPYLIHFTLGDPDSGEALAFERQGSRPN